MKRLVPGDVCILTDKASSTWGKPGDRIIIEKAERCQGTLEFSTHVGAWLHEEDLELFMPANRESLELLNDYSNLENGEEFDEDNEEGIEWDDWSEKRGKELDARLKALNTVTMQITHKTMRQAIESGAKTISSIRRQFYTLCEICHWRGKEEPICSGQTRHNCGHPSYSKTGGSADCCYSFCPFTEDKDKPLEPFATRNRIIIRS